VGEWWTDFFDRSYTEVWTAAGAFDRTGEEVAALVTLLGPGPLRVLDVPCGWGRHAGPLHAAGHDVTGVDASADQLALARERHPGPTYVQADMRTPPPGPYDVVLNLFSSFGYLGADGDAAALRAWHDVLVPGGHLVLEGMHRDRMAKMLEEGVEQPIGDSGAVETGTVDWLAGIAHRVIRLADGTERPFSVRMYTATELVALVDAAGFGDVRVVGGWGAEPLSPTTRLLLTARRPPAATDR
jgi:SAM-dependent methyltransferase